jgi:methylated-DNA-[protein]-cysteine S-methyltransferase
MTRVGSPVPALRAAVFPSNLGWMAVVWHERRVHQIAFGHPRRQAALAAVGRQAAAGHRLESTQQNLVERLQALAAGTPDDFLDVELDLCDRTAFQREVLEQCRRIPRGQVSTYSQLAARAGYPGAARAVGNVMAANRVPLIVPCHRVVGASGKLGGFSAPQGLDMKRQLLQLEGALLRGS